MRSLVAFRGIVMHLSSLLSYSQGNRYFDDNVRDDYAAGQLDAQVSRACLAVEAAIDHTCQVEGVLQEMRELTICGAQ